MPEVIVNGVRLHYDEAGDGPETIVFSHSYLLDGRHFAPQLDALSARYRCVAYDHRGHGRSEAARSGYEMEGLYADGLGVIEALGLAPCHWVGLSTGGFVGLRLALRRPDLLRGLVLMDTSADPEPRANRLRYRAMLLLLQTFGYWPLVGAVERILYGPRFRRDPARRDERQRWRARITAHDIPAMVRFGRGIFARDGLRERLGEITVPTLVVVGEHDKATPPATARRIADGIPGARLVVIPEAGHLTTLEAPDEVNRALEEFLASVAP
jgi:3-oxoadipate enol-lactonase